MYIIYITNTHISDRLQAAQAYLDKANAVHLPYSSRFRPFYSKSNCCSHRETEMDVRCGDCPPKLVCRNLESCNLVQIAGTSHTWKKRAQFVSQVIETLEGVVKMCYPDNFCLWVGSWLYCPYTQFISWKKPEILIRKNY